MNLKLCLEQFCWKSAFETQTFQLNFIIFIFQHFIFIKTQSMKNHEQLYDFFWNGNISRKKNQLVLSSNYQCKYILKVKMIQRLFQFFNQFCFVCLWWELQNRISLSFLVLITWQEWKKLHKIRVSFVETEKLIQNLQNCNVLTCDKLEQKFSFWWLSWGFKFKLCLLVQNFWIFCIWLIIV